MSKIIVPQELQKQIIDLYVNQGLGRTTIVRKLKLPFSEKVVKRVLQENNIPIRNATGGGAKKMEVSRELQDKIIEKYNLGWGLDKIVEQLNLPFSFDKVRSILQDNNVHIRTVRESALVKTFPDSRKYSINDNYDWETRNGAYMLGFIAADGYLPVTRSAHNRVTIKLAEQDKELLQLFKKELQYTGPIGTYENGKGYFCAALSFTSKQIRQTLESYGICNNKTFKLKHLPQNLPQHLMIDYIRGYFDGDGSIYIGKDKKVGMSLCSVNETFLEEIGIFLHEQYNVSKPRIHVQHRLSLIHI